ncbi:MAG: NAD(P)/FAD-dependent oxidoreductase [Chitinophagaceae bacterium]
MVISNKKIAIIGGGPGGLTLARLLQLKGANVNVYERDINKDARVQGATLDLHYESGLRALREADLMQAFQENYRPGADRVRITDQYANIISEDAMTDDTENSRPEIDRGPLRKILLESLQPETIIWKSHFIEMKKEGKGWKLHFANGTTAYADIVIAADGANSKIRPYITSIKPFYSGITIVEGAIYNSAETIPVMHQLLNGGKIFAMGDSKSIIVSSKGDGSLVFYTGCRTNEFWVKESGIDFTDKAQVLQWFTTSFAGWNKIWISLFENATLPFIPRPQYCMPLDQYWEPLPNLTMLGDAAHLMPPYAGEGVNMAMLDAVELSDALTNSLFTDSKTAIAYYENNMRARASAVAEETLQQTEMLHSPGAIEHLKNIMS